MNDEEDDKTLGARHPDRLSPLFARVVVGARDMRRVAKHALGKFEVHAVLALVGRRLAWIPAPSGHWPPPLVATIV